MEPCPAPERLHIMKLSGRLVRVLPMILLVAAIACAGDDSRATGESIIGQTAQGVPDALETGDPTPTPEPTPSTTPSEPFHFVAIGDFGTGRVEQKQVADRMCAFRQKHPFDMVVTTGDNIYASGQPEAFASKFFEPYDCLLSDGVRFRSALGNHDIVSDNGRPELEEPAFGMEARNYVVRRAGVRFVIANSNALNMEWLRNALSPQTGDAWTVVSFHHPVFSGGNEHGPTPGFADSLPDLFARKGVDLVLTGHDHVYSVSREVRGIRYVVTGGGGARGYGCKDAPKVVRCIPKFHFLSVTVGPTEITVKAIPRFGAPLHRFSTDGV